MPFKNADDKKEYNKKFYAENKHKYICEHNIKRCLCVECGGVSICEHNKRKTLCVECGGGSLCIHKREKRRCKDCKIIQEYERTGEIKKVLAEEEKIANRKEKQYILMMRKVLTDCGRECYIYKVKKHNEKCLKCIDCRMIKSNTTI